MPTNEERREVAARLRAIEFDLETESALEIELDRFYNALECNLGQMNCGLNPYKYLADLIEPEKERMCRPVHTRKKWQCGACGCVIRPGFMPEFNGVGALHYCPNCSAKVVSDD